MHTFRFRILPYRLMHIPVHRTYPLPSFLHPPIETILEHFTLTFVGQFHTNPAHKEQTITAIGVCSGCVYISCTA